MELLMCVFDFIPVGLFAGVIILLTIWYLMYTKDYDYWKKQGVPADRPWPIMGTFKPIWIHTQQDQDMKAFKRYGHVYGGFEGNRPVLHVSDPDMIKQILIKDFQAFPSRRHFPTMEKDKFLGNMIAQKRGREWKSLRNTLTPTFTAGKLKQMIPLIEECILSLSESLQTQADNGETIEFSRKFAILTLDVISSTAFGVKIDAIKTPNSEFVTKAQQLFRRSPVIMYILILFSPILKFFPNLIPQPPVKYFAETAYKAVDMRIQNKGAARHDILQTMLEAEISDDESNDPETQEAMKKGSRKHLSRDVIVAQTVMFLTAGHETVANTLNHLAYILAVNQDIQSKLMKEVDKVMIECKGKLSYEAIKGMQYLDMVVTETLRFYPPGVRVERQCAEEGYKINGISLRNDMIVIIPIYVIHHNPEFYPNPEKFDPERFSPEHKAARNPFTYLPFGHGPRQCIAMRFALLEIKLTIVHLLYNFGFHTCEETDIPIKFLKSGLGFLQAESINLKLLKRLGQPSFN